VLNPALLVLAIGAAGSALRRDPQAPMQ
jgi:hypothetical protein